MLQILVQKYNQQAPRYTSYPPIPYWNGTPSMSAWIQSVQKHNEASGGVDLYIHIPFCFKLCWYCGCNRVISKDTEQAKAYVEALICEWNKYKKVVPNLKVRSLHFGGGTPNFLPAKNLDQLLQALASDMKESFIGSIEVDPRTLNGSHLEVLKKFGFKRISMGIQDFDFQVQQAINRIQSFVLVEKLVTQIRALGFESLNFDLIYGLPKQTKDTVRETIQKVSILKPDLIALYSYAHLPRVLKNQRLIKNEDLPSPENKRELYELAKTLLEQEGYIEIGLDHFCLPDSYLGKAYRSNGLKRNFMGYTDKKSNCLVGLGVSAISSTPEMYVQNKKDVQTYYESLKKEEFDFHTGHVLTPEDKIVDMIIQNIMCTRMTDLNQLKDFIYFKEIENKLHEMQNDGLLEYQNDFFEVTEEGNAFLRNIAHVFDRYAHKNEEKKFSQTI